MLYNHLAFPHRVAMDALGDWNRRDKVSPLVEMLWARGNKYEERAIEGLGLEFADLSTLSGDDKGAAIRAAIANLRGRSPASGFLLQGGDIHPADERVLQDAAAQRD